MTSSSSKVHRRLRLTSPNLEGPDVVALQHAINARAAGRGIEPVEVDGEYGPDTRAALRRVVYALGGITSYFDKHGATETYQRIVRLQKRRPRRWSVAAKRRRKKATGAATVLSWARKQLGVSNRYANPVKGWLAKCGIGAAPWCGAFVVNALRAAGVSAPSSWVYTPTILSDARAGRYGYRIVSTPEPGDLVLFKWPGVSGDTCDHVGLVETVDGGGMNASIEGNTSGSTGGSQHNGDSCQRKFRNGYGVVAFVRPPYTA